MINHPVNHQDNLKPGVSVVVCCYNSGHVVNPTIDALAHQEVPPGAGYEVILVDNNCTDDTLQKAQKAWRNQTHPLRIVKESEPGLIYARKTGVSHALYNILLFVDDDNILEPGWITRLRDIYREMPNVGAVGGYNEAFYLGDAPDWFDRYCEVYACGPRDDCSRLNPKKVFGAGMSFRTSVIKSILFSDLPFFLVGRTKNILTRGEDTEMSLRCRLMGWDIYYDDSLRLRHCLTSGKLNWSYVCRARKLGGSAGIILQIYNFLLAGKIFYETGFKPFFKPKAF